MTTDHDLVERARDQIPLELGYIRIMLTVMERNYMTELMPEEQISLHVLVREFASEMADRLDTAGLSAVSV